MEIRDGSYFCKKFVYVFTDPQMDRSFVESIKNLQRFNFLKIFVIAGGMRPPKTPTERFFCHPSKSRWEVPRNIPHHLAKLLHAV